MMTTPTQQKVGRMVDVYMNGDFNFNFLIYMKIAKPLPLNPYRIDNESLLDSMI